MTLGEKIKKLRNEKGLTQKELADQLHVSFQTVSKWENDENEPDIATIKEFTKLFGCTLDYLLNDEDEKQKEESVPEIVEEEKPQEEAPKTIIIHQNELHVCTRCHKDIPENELYVEEGDRLVRPGGRGHSAEYAHYQAYYHRKCHIEAVKEREAAAKRAKDEKASRNKKVVWGWSIAGGAVALTIALLVMLLVPACQEVIQPGFAVLYSFIASYGIFSMLYCIISGSYIGDVFVWCAGLSIKFPGLIFTWDLGGFAWLIVMKILFAVLGFLIGVLALLFAIVLSATLGAFSFPFVLIHNIHTDYEDVF